MVVFCLSVLKTFVGIFRYDSVTFYDIGHVEHTATLGEVDGAVHADIFVGFVGITMAHNPHFA